MSCLMIFGFFALTSGHRKVTTKMGRNDNEIKTYHFHYTTSIQCTTSVALPADLRIYSSVNDILLPDDTVAFVIAKMFLPPHEVVLLDAFHIVEVPGDPNDDAYQDCIPNLPNPFVVGVGEVVTTDETLSDGKGKVFGVTTSEYVRDGPKHSTVQCYLDRARPRWSNTPIPRLRTIIQFFGLCNYITGKGLLRIELESLSLNLGQNVAPITGLDGSLDTTSSGKRRKFNAVATVHPKASQRSPTHTDSQVSGPSQTISIDRSPSPIDGTMHVATDESISTLSDKSILSGSLVINEPQTGSAKSRGKRKARDDV